MGIHNGKKVKGKSDEFRPRLNALESKYPPLGVGGFLCDFTILRPVYNHTFLKKQ